MTLIVGTQTAAAAKGLRQVDSRFPAGPRERSSLRQTILRAGEIGACQRVRHVTGATGTAQEEAQGRVGLFREAVQSSAKPRITGQIAGDCAGRERQPAILQFPADHLHRRVSLLPFMLTLLPSTASNSMTRSSSCGTMFSSVIRRTLEARRPIFCQRRWWSIYPRKNGTVARPSSEKFCSSKLMKR